MTKLTSYFLPILICISLLFIDCFLTKKLDPYSYEYVVNQFDTIKQWCKQRPINDTWSNNFLSPDDPKQVKFDSLTQLIDSSFIVLLQKPLARSLPIAKDFNTLVSPDSTVFIINYGEANISGTGRYNRNVLYLPDPIQPIASIWNDNVYEYIDTLMLKDTTLYLFIARQRISNSSISFEVQPYFRIGNKLSVYKNKLFFNEQDELNILFPSHSDTSAIEFGEERLYYTPTDKNITMNHPRIELSLKKTGQTLLKAINPHSTNINKYKRIGAINQKLVFDRKKGKYVFE